MLGDGHTENKKKISFRDFPEKIKCQVGFRVYVLYTHKILLKIVGAYFVKIEMFTLFLCELHLILTVSLKRKKRNGDICKRNLNIEFERDWSHGLSKPYVRQRPQRKTVFFFSFGDFCGENALCHIVEV